MPLRGSLRDFNISQLLNLINLAGKTGALIVESPAETAEVVFQSGKLAYAQVGRADGSLAGILYKAKKLSASQYQSLRQRAGSVSDKELGLMLINAGYFTQEDILTNLQHHFVGVVQNLFTWAEGAFHFENDQRPPENRISVQVDLANLIIEGTRRMQELEQLEDEIPSLDMALKFSDRPGANLRNVNLSVEEWRVISFINPRNTIRQIARATHKDHLEIRRIIYGFLQAGLVELTRQADAAPAVLPIKPFPTENRQEKISLVQRLINRIRSL
jgi:hypothetical protein